MKAWAPWATTRRWRLFRKKSRMLYDYFKQLFAQVTNPPIDVFAKRSSPRRTCGWARKATC